ncbi:MAG: hypothetical protein ACOH2E_07165 [Candidatus Paracaedibacter sp.]
MGSSLKISLCLLWVTTRASAMSLMLSPVEEAALIHAQDQARTNKGSKNSNILRLNGIIYTHPTSWTIWINGCSIKAGEVVEALQILKVTSDSVELIWNPKADLHHHICLKPNEVFQNTDIHP